MTYSCINEGTTLLPMLEKPMLKNITYGNKKTLPFLPMLQKTKPTCKTIRVRNMIIFSVGSLRLRSLTHIANLCVGK